MDTLSIFTSVINFVALSVSVWLGWYILTRSPRRLVSWLTSLTLFSLSGIFLNMLLALNPPPIPPEAPEWVQTLFIFWRPEVVLGESGGWLTGWLATPAIAFWHHATMELRPGKKSFWHHIQTGLVYLTVCIAIIVQIRNPYSLTGETSGPTHLGTEVPGIIYITFMSLLFIFAILSSVNLFISAKMLPSKITRRQFITLAIATIIAGFTGPISLISTEQIMIPRAINTILLIVPVVLIGYSVAWYSALIDGRTIRREFIYNATAIGIVTLIYSAITWISVQLFDVPPAAFVFIIVLAITTHSLIDFTRRNLDFIFYRKEDRALRRNLRQLARLMGEQDIGQTLQIILDSTCESVRATYAFILLFEGRSHHIVASYKWREGISHLPASTFSADDLIHLDIGQFPEPLNEAGLLVPLYAEANQIGAIVFGCPVNSITYPDADIERLLDVSDQVTDTFLAVQRGEELAIKAAQMAEAYQIEPKVASTKTHVKEVENALRNIFDYAILGDSLLAELRLVTNRLSEDAVTHLDRGKVVYEVLEEAVMKLRPEADYPGDPAPREWHAYTILHGAYFENKLNRDIMSQLYISEGTFNRTRRAAIRTVSRVLTEMESVQH
jgi:hypothetical protein